MPRYTYGGAEEDGGGKEEKGECKMMNDYDRIRSMGTVTDSSNYDGCRGIHESMTRAFQAGLMKDSVARKRLTGDYR